MQFIRDISKNNKEIGFKDMPGKCEQLKNKKDDISIESSFHGMNH